MERELTLEEIMANYEAAQRETVNGLKKLLQQRTQKALGLKALREDVKEKAFGDIDLDVKDLLLDGAIIEQGQTEVAYGATHAVLRPDGKLYKLRVLGGPGEEGDWEYQGTLQGEITDQEFLDIAPLVIKEVEMLISEVQRKS